MSASKLGTPPASKLAATGADAAAALVPGTDYVVPTGIAGGQTVAGGTAAGDNLTLLSTTAAAKGKIFLGPNSVYDGATGRIGINDTAPAVLAVFKATTGPALLRLDAVDGAAASTAVVSVRSAGTPLGALQACGPLFSGGGAAFAPNSGVLYGGGAGGLSVGAIAGALKLLSGGATDASIRATIDSAGVWTIPAFGKVATVVGAATSTFTISGLTGNAAGNYHLRIHLINPTASDVTIRVRPNGATTGLAASEIYQVGAGGPGGTDDSCWGVCSMRANSQGWITMTVQCQTGSIRRMVSHGQSSGGGAINQVLAAGTYSETAAEITSFDVVSDVADSIGVGSSIRAINGSCFLG